MTFSFGKNSLAKLVHVEPALVKVVERALSISTIDFGVTDGIRTLDQQKKLVASGASQTLNSKHLPNSLGFSEAVDLAAYLDTDGDGDKEFSWHQAHCLQVASAMRAAARIEGVLIRWGGCWKVLNDLSADLDEEVARYMSSWAANNPKSAGAGRGPFLDMPHYELFHIRG